MVLSPESAQCGPPPGAGSGGLDSLYLSVWVAGVSVVGSDARASFCGKDKLGRVEAVPGERAGRDHRLPWRLLGVGVPVGSACTWALLGRPRLSGMHPGPCALLSGGLSRDLTPRGPCLVHFGASGHPSGVGPWLKKEATLHLPRLLIYGRGHGMAAPGCCGTSASSTRKAAGCGHVPVCRGLQGTVHPFLHQKVSPGELRTRSPGLLETRMPAPSCSGHATFLLWVSVCLSESEAGTAPTSQDRGSPWVPTRGCSFLPRDGTGLGGFPDTDLNADVG